KVRPCHPERSEGSRCPPLTPVLCCSQAFPVILSEAKDLATGRERPFASLRVTQYDCSNSQEHFVQIEPCLNKLMGISHTGDEAAVGADLSCAPPIYRPTATPPHIRVILLIVIIGLDTRQLTR